MTKKPPVEPAIERLRAHIEAQVAIGFRKRRKYLIPDLAKLTKSEEKVFDLPKSDMPRLAATYWAWETSCRTIGDNLYDDPGLIEALRELPIVQKGTEAFHQRRPHPDFLELWIEFAALFDIPYRPALAFFWKNYFQRMRRFQIVYDDSHYGPETPDPYGVRPF